MVYTDIGSRERLEQQGLPVAAHNRTLPHWLIPNPTLRCRANALPSRPDLILVVPIKHKKVGIEARTRGGQLAAATAAARLAADEESATSVAAAKRWTHRAFLHTRRTKGVLRAHKTRGPAGGGQATAQGPHLQHSEEIQAHHASCHSSGGGGVIYKSYTDEPMLQLGLDRSGAAKLVHQLHTHAVQCAKNCPNTPRARVCCLC